MADFLQFGENEIRKKIPMATAIDLMRHAFAQLSNGEAIVPVRTVIETKERNGQALFMPSYSPAFGLFGLKMVSVFAGNAEKSLPIIQGKMLVMDSVYGTPLAVLDAQYLTALRTGAASGLATDLLARKNARVLAIFGTGAQAITQLEGVMAVRDIREILIFGRTSQQASDFCSRMKGKPGTIIRPAHADEIGEADIICTATTSVNPVFEHSRLRKGVHINAIGAFKATMQEIPAATIQQSTLVVDQREAALIEAGDVVIPLRAGLIDALHIHATLGEIIDGTQKGRTSDDQLTVFKSVGNAIQDLALAYHLLK